VFFSDRQTSKTVGHTSAQHALGQWPSTPPGRKPVPGRQITKCILVVTALTFWACGWLILLMEALLRVWAYPRAAATLSSADRSAVTKGLGTAALVYIFENFIVDK